MQSFKALTATPSGKLTQGLVFALIWIAALLTLVVLILIVGILLVRGLPSVNLEFLTGVPEDLGRSGGILPTILGTVILGLVSLVIATPLGIGAAPSDPPGEKQHHEDDQDDADDADAAMTVAVAITPEAATEAANQEDDEKDHEDDSKRRHERFLLAKG